MQLNAAICLSSNPTLHVTPMLLTRAFLLLCAFLVAITLARAQSDPCLLEANVGNGWFGAPQKYVFFASSFSLSFHLFPLIAPSCHSTNYVLHSFAHATHVGNHQTPTQAKQNFCGKTSKTRLTAAPLALCCM